MENKNTFLIKTKEFLEMKERMSNKKTQSRNFNRFKSEIPASPFR